MPGEHVYSEGDSHVVVTDGDVQSGIDLASEGEIVYIRGSASGSVSVDTPDLTIAGNRGIGDDGRWSNCHIDQNARNLRLDGLVLDGSGGNIIRVKDSGLTCYNCVLEDVDSGHGAVGWDTGDTGATFTSCTMRNWWYYGLQVRYNWHDESSKIVVEHCDMHDLGQHMIQGGLGWIHARDNHFHGGLDHSVDHIVEVRGTSGPPVHCGDSCGNVIVEHNVNEATGSSGARAGLVRVRGVPTDGAWVEYNHSPGSSPASGGCYQNGSHGGWNDQIVMQPSASGNSLEKVYLTGNVLSQNIPGGGHDDDDGGNGDGGNGDGGNGDGGNGDDDNGGDGGEQPGGGNRRASVARLGLGLGVVGGLWYADKGELPGGYQPDDLIPGR